MLNIASLLLSLTLFLGFTGNSALAQGAFVSLPGLEVNTSADGATVNMPNMKVDTRGGTTVATPNVNVQTGGYSNEARVRTPGVNVQTDGYGTRVHTPGVHVQTTAPITRTPGVIGSGMSYMNADLIGMNFRNKYLVGADFTNANVSNADFTGADLRGAIFLNTDLTNTNFTHANMIGANFTNADFIHTNLSYADLSQANLTNVTIDGALATNTRFDGANLTNVDMSLFVRGHVTQQQTVRPTFTNARMISSALTIDPSKPSIPKRMDLTINFALDSDILSEAGMRQVKEIADALHSPELRGSRIVLEGHTDNTGNEAYNQELSYRRAMRVLFTLRDQYKIPGAFLEAKGYGETRPIASNKSDMGRTLNRRVTIVNKGK